MDKNQRSKLNMFVAVLLYFKKYTTLFAGYAQLLIEITAFSSLATDLETDIGEQKKDTRGVTASKNSLVTEAIRMVVKVARKGRVWAENAKEIDLEQVFNIHTSDFNGLGDSIILDHLAIVVKALNDNLVTMVGYKLTAADMLLVAAAMTAARDSVSTTTQAKAVKVVSTQNIETKLAEGMNQLVKIDDLLITEFEDTNPEEVNEYRQNRIVNPIGTHHTGIAATVTNTAKTALLGVNCNIAEIKRSGLTNHIGLVEISKFKTGTYEIVFSHPGYDNYTLILEIPSGKTVNFNVVMKATG